MAAKKKTVKKEDKAPVSRAEYNQLKNRLLQLEAWIRDRFDQALCLDDVEES